MKEIDDTTKNDIQAYWSHNFPNREQFIKNSLRNDLFEGGYDFLNIREIVKQCDYVVDILEKNNIRYAIATLPSCLVFYTNENNQINSSVHLMATRTFLSNDYLEEFLVNDEKVMKNGVILYTCKNVKDSNIRKEAFFLRFAICEAKMILPEDIKSFIINDKEVLC